MVENSAGSDGVFSYMIDVFFKIEFTPNGDAAVFNVIWPVYWIVVVCKR